MSATETDAAELDRGCGSTAWTASLLNVTKYCREAVDLLVSAHGTSSLADSNRLQRLWRDVHVASHHAITEWQVNLEVYGKALLGVEPNITPLI
jgi:3-hydroxy-9,10-secoandrosta-1,3,5(10)-triene-9,17-dione monooxygenase